MADKIVPTSFQSYEVQKLAEQVVEQIRCLWGAKKELSERIEPLEADLERRQGNRTIDPRHLRIRETLKIMEGIGLDKEFFCGMTSINAGTNVIAYASMNKIDLGTDRGTRNIITKEIMKYYNLKRHDKSGKFYDDEKE